MTLTLKEIWEKYFGPFKAENFIGGKTYETSNYNLKIIMPESIPSSTGMSKYGGVKTYAEMGMGTKRLKNQKPKKYSFRCEFVAYINGEYQRIFYSEKVQRGIVNGKEMSFPENAQVIFDWGKFHVDPMVKPDLMFFMDLFPANHDSPVYWTESQYREKKLDPNTDAIKFPGEMSKSYRAEGITHTDSHRAKKAADMFRVQKFLYEETRSNLPLLEALCTKYQLSLPNPAYKKANPQDYLDQVRMLLLNYADKNPTGFLEDKDDYTTTLTATLGEYMAHKLITFSKNDRIWGIKNEDNDGYNMIPIPVPYDQSEFVWLEGYLRKNNRAVWERLEERFNEIAKPKMSDVELLAEVERRGLIQEKRGRKKVEEPAAP